MKKSAKGVQPKITGRERLRDGVTGQRALEQKIAKQTGVKKDLVPIITHFCI